MVLVFVVFAAALLLSCNVECTSTGSRGSPGKPRDSKIATTVVGGSASPTVLYQVSLADPTVTPELHFCTGSLISRQWVLTTASCFCTTANICDTQRVVNVHFGSLSRRQGEIRGVAQIVIHPNYDGTPYFADLALLKLDLPIANASPLPISSAPELSCAGQNAIAEGWGETDTLKATETAVDQLSRLAVFTVSDADILLTLKSGEVSVPVPNALRNLQCTSSNCVPTLLGAASRLPGGTLCKGDTGAALAVSHKESPIGVVAVAMFASPLHSDEKGVECAPLYTNGTRMPHVYLQLDTFVQFISKYAGQGLLILGPQCGDGRTNPSEGCDDGNAISGDGCSNKCAVESGFMCTPNTGDPLCQPSSCTYVGGSVPTSLQAVVSGSLDVVCTTVSSVDVSQLSQGITLATSKPSQQISIGTPSLVSIGTCRFPYTICCLSTLEAQKMANTLGSTVVPSPLVSSGVIKLTSITKSSLSIGDIVPNVEGFISPAPYSTSPVADGTINGAVALLLLCVCCICYAACGFAYYRFSRANSGGDGGGGGDEFGMGLGMGGFETGLDFPAMMRSVPEGGLANPETEEQSESAPVVVKEADNLV